MNYFPLHVHSTYSLQRSIIQPDALAKKCKSLGFTGATLTDYNSVSGVVPFVKACKKEGLKWILGTEFNVVANAADFTYQSIYHNIVLARNLQGWKNLMKLISLSNVSFWFREPRIDLANLNGADLVGISGYFGSDLSAALFTNPDLAYRAKVS